MGILLAAGISIFTNAQSPGGIAPQLWYKADAGITNSAGTVTQWNNSASPGTYDLIQQGGAGTAPAYNTSQINFNPSVRFDGVDDRLAAPSVPQNTVISPAAPYQSSHYIVYRKVGSASLPLYNHSDGSGGTWNVGANANAGMLVTNRSVGTTAPAVNETRLQSANGTSNSLSIYVNGQFKSSTFSNANAVATAGTQSFWVGGQGLNGFMNADIAEIVIYNSTKTPERPQIESYLSLKYGITKAGDYIASDGTTVYWNSTTNSAYSNNIAGIARDDNSALYQKQSMSINAGQQLLIGLTGMANTNASNSGTLTNMQSLVVGDNGLAKAPTTFVSNVPGTNFIFGSVWKVQNTGSVGTVRVMWPKGLNNLKLVQNSSDPTFASGNTITDMSANTQTINGVVYNYADVSMADGQFFTFASYVQAPGGIISNLRVWIKADDNPNGNTTDNVAISTWPNKGQIGGNFVGGAASPNTIALQTTGPLYRNSPAMNINFNPVAQSTSTSGLGMLNAFATVGDDYTMIALNKNSNLGGFRNMFSFHGGSNLNGTSGSNTWFGTYINTPIAWPSAAGTSAYTVNTPAVTTFSATGTGTIAYQVNSVAKGSGGTLSKSGTNLVIGVDADGGPDDGIDIVMPENIMYNAVLNAADYNKVVSYIAIKYGVTLGTFAAPVTYTGTNGTAVWSTAANTYQNNVIGIARDDIEALHQRIAKSQDATADIITLSTNNDFTAANTSAGHADIVNDQFYFMTGNNGAATTYNAQNLMLRRWKVQSTGTAQNLYIKTSDSQATYLVYADDAAITTNVVNIQLTGGATSAIQIPNGKFFTFGKFTYCTQPPNNSPANMITKIGITTQSKQSGWPENIPNGAVALESKTKGFVITRTQSSSIANPVEGMLIYDTVSKCMKLYNGTSWNCVVRSCNQ